MQTSQLCERSSRRAGEQHEEFVLLTAFAISTPFQFLGIPSHAVAALGSHLSSVALTALFDVTLSSQ